MSLNATTVLKTTTCGDSQNENHAEYGASSQNKVHLRCIAESTSLHQAATPPTLDGWPLSSQARLTLDHDESRPRLTLAEGQAILKQRYGTGGTVKDGRIEIQGDQRERIVVELEKLGYKVKRVRG